MLNNHISTIIAGCAFIVSLLGYIGKRKAVSQQAVDNLENDIRHTIADLQEQIKQCHFERDEAERKNIILLERLFLKCSKQV